MNTQDSIQVKGISVIHQNLQSIGNCVDEINQLLRQHTGCVVLCITEHWKSDSQLQNYGIENFCLVSSVCRSKDRHGGSAIYIRDDLEGVEITNLCQMSILGQCECSVVSCRMGGNQLVVLSVYRPTSGNTEVFKERLEEILLALNGAVSEEAAIIIAGDLNIELLEHNSDGQSLSSLLKSFNFTQTIFENTRITGNCRSCIDNIFINNNVGRFQACVLHTKISDHTAQKLTFYVDDCVNNSNVHLKRIFNEKNKVKFIRNLESIDWTFVYSVNPSDVNQQWNAFMKYFLMIFNHTFPLKKITESRRTIKKWKADDPVIVACKKKLDALYVVKMVDNRYNHAYNDVKRCYNKLLQENRYFHFQNELIGSDNKSKCVWNIVNKIKGKKLKTKELPIGGEAKTVANNFNHFLVDNISQLALNSQSNSFVAGINNNRSMFVKPTDNLEILSIAKTLKNKMSCGTDEIPTAIVKMCIQAVVDPVCYIINNSLLYGIFPDNLKTAQVIPVYKKGNRSEMGSYRPISLLPAFSKLFESVMCGRLVDYMRANNLFSGVQHGYLRGRSTITAVYQFIQEILTHLEKRNIAMGLFLDLSKAYDSLNHRILLQKLEGYGVRGVALHWFQSYLSDRTQAVSIFKEGDKVISDLLGLKTGVPQGSLMGPVLFIVYINDLSSAVAVGNMTVVNYADDTSILVGADTFGSAVQKAGMAMQRAGEYYRKSQLVLNSEKTKIVLFRTKQSTVTTPDEIIIDNTKYLMSSNTKFLGIYMDEFLTWDTHVEQVSSRLSSVCYSIRVLSRYVDLLILKIVYHSNFEALVRYGLVFYGSSRDIEQVFLMQKRVLRIMLGMKCTESCRGKFRENGLRTVTGLYIQECLLFLFKNRQYFSDNIAQSVYETRSLDYIYPKHRLTLTEKGAHYNCLKFHNALPHSLKETRNLIEFKNKVQKMILAIEPYNIDEFMNFDKRMFSN